MLPQFEHLSPDKFAEALAYSDQGEASETSRRSEPSLPHWWWIWIGESENVKLGVPLSQVGRS